MSATRLSSHDYQCLLESGARLHASADPAQLPHIALCELRKLVPCDTVAWNTVDWKRRQIAWHAEPWNYYPDMKSLMSRLQPYLHEHPLIQHFQKTGDGEAMKITDFLSQTEFHRLALYHEFYRPLQIEFQIAFVLPPQNGSFVGVSLNRQKSDFSDRDRLMLNLFRRQVIQAHVRAEAIVQATTYAKNLEGILESNGLSLLIVNRKGRILQLSANCEARLRKYGLCLTRNQQCLAGMFGHWFAAQSRQTGVGWNQSSPLQLEAEGWQLHLRLIRSPFHDQWTILMMEKPVSVSLEALMALGLTHREAEVLRWMAEGKTNLEIAIILGITRTTVKSHVEHLMGKLGASNRVVAARMALQAARASQE
jgi:DNA-binding CsgD family transcriptional regulator